jgi:REP element-mobilizing transposase RayT
MVTYGVKSGDPLILNAQDRFLIARYISAACHSHTIPVVAWNVLPDHVHMILAAEDEQKLDELVRKIKGFSSYSFQRAHGWDEGGHVWAQKYHHLLITDQSMLESSYSYVMDNHIKHAQQWGQELIDSFEVHLTTLPTPPTSPSSPSSPSSPTRGLQLSTPPTRGLSPLLDTSSSPSLKDLRDSLCVTPEIACQPSPGGFDIIIGNPPYIRIQALKEWAPLEVEFYKQHFISASKGNYDIYVVFVEKGLSLLSANGHLGFILPHKFFNAQYGQSLRTLLSEGKHLAKVVHFGDKQIFENATTYTCLMFLAKSGREVFDIEKVDDLQTWRAGVPGVHGELPATRVVSAEWNFTVGRGVNLFDKFTQMPEKLEDVAHRIFQGFKTGADPVFILEERNYEEFYSPALNKDISIESIYLRPLYKSGEMKRYCLRRNSRYVIFPYNNGSLIEWSEIVSIAPKTAAYLEKCKSLLANREKGRWIGKHWYCYSRNQALEVISNPKLLTADLNPFANYCFDRNGDACFPGGAAGGYGIVLDENMYLYVLGLLNSKAVDFFHKNISTNYRGGWYGYDAKIIRNIPIRTINFSDPTDLHLYEQVVFLVERMLNLHQHLATALAPTEVILLQRQIDTTDAQIDALVYELYELTEEEIRLVEGR